MDPLSLKIKHGFSTEVRHVMLSFITLPLRKDEEFPLRTCKMKIFADQFRFPGNCQPTPPLTQY